MDAASSREQTPHAPVGVCRDYAAEAKRHRQMAEQYHIMAVCTPEDSLRDHYCQLAEAYERLAQNEAQLARSLKN